MEFLDVNKSERILPLNFKSVGNGFILCQTTMAHMKMVSSFWEDFQALRNRLSKPRCMHCIGDLGWEWIWLSTQVFYFFFFYFFFNGK